MVELQGANAELLAIAAITPHMCMAGVSANGRQER
jgi:hypothetical protein